ncbi:MAG: hypothetical protein QOD60_1067 [Solirubrobacterales bacterium]|jgi:hypothetical protein|nr:hypothetical protein [Solirubrobacterales bacterium]
MRPGTRKLAVLLIACIVTGAAASAAVGYWNGFQTSLSGPGAGSAATVNQGSAPSVGEAGSRNVVVTWGSSSLSDGSAASGYKVRRYDEASGQEGTILSGCTGTVAGNTCTEPGAAVGRWQYTVTPVFATNWHGAESSKSGVVDTGPGTMTLQKTLFGGTVAPLPATVSGTVSGFSAGEAITYTLDDTVTLAASPSHVGSDGTATISLTIPAGTSDGPHTVSVNGNDANSTVGIIVDTTAPTLTAFTTPTPNAAGWNNTSPVEVNGTGDDGSGSGIAYAKSTSDGTDPKTSPTAIYVTAPFPVSVTTTFKAYLVDIAGNESPVLTHQVKIDTIPPLFTVDFVDVVGNVYITPTSPEGIPGQAYYRGAAAGSYRIRITPTPMGGSPAIAAGFSSLIAGTDGFSFDSTSVTTPAGGPFVSAPVSWVAGTDSSPSGTVTLYNAAGSSFGSAGGQTNDSTAPTGGSVDATGLTGTGGRYSTSLNINLNLAKGTDSQTGVADGSAPTDIPLRLMRASAPLSSSNGIANGSCGTYGAYVQVGSDNPAATVSNTVPSDATCYRFRYDVPDHIANVAQYTSPDIKVKATAAASLRPTDATITPVSGTSAQSVSGSTVYYNPALSGSFNVDSSASAPFVGVAQMSFPALGGFTGGGVQTTPNSGTTYRTVYSWSGNAASASPGAQALAATDNAGNTATNSTALSVVKDDVGPTGGSVDATGLTGTGGRYSSVTNLSVGFTPGTDAGSGLATTGRQLLRASASLTSGGTTNGSCGTFGPYTQVGANDPATPFSDTVPVDRSCYSYRYVVADKVGNQTTYTSPDVKVDATQPPAPSLSFSNLNNVYWSGSGSAIFYRPGAATGGFRLTASSVDTTAGIASYTFPTLPSGWTGASGGTGIRDYSWSPANPTAPSGAQSVAANNNAGRQSSSTFTATPDSTLPSGGTVTYTNGYSTLSAISVAFTPGTDAGSGLATSSGLLERASATLINGVCGTFGAFTNAATNPTTPNSNAVVTGNCYQYRYLISDNVGNQAIYTSASIVKVDTVAPTNTLSLSTPVGASLTAPAIVYYKSNAVGSFKLVDTVTDAASGPASAIFPAIATTGWTHSAETISTPAGGPYTSATFSWTANPTNPTGMTVTGTDAAGNATNTSVTFVSDITAPTGGSIAYTNGVLTAPSVPVTLVDGTDAGSGISSLVVKRDVTTLTKATDVCAAFPGTFATTVTLVGGADTSVSDGNCYQYRYVVTDKVGNTITYTSASVAKVHLPNNYSPTVLATPGLLNYWRLGETGTATIAVDSKGTNNGTYFNLPTLGVAGAISGDANTAADFDGASDYATVARSIQDDFSIEFWFKSTAGAGAGAQWDANDSLIDATVSGAANDFGISLRHDGKITAGIGTPDVSVLSPLAYNNGAWHHVVFTRTKATGVMTLYVDGAAVGSAIGSTLSLTSPTAVSFARRLGGGGTLATTLDEVAFYNSALSAATVADHYNRQ